MINLETLPPSMKKRAVWARKNILNFPEKVEIDEDELIAWIYNKEDKVWYSIDGNYSHSSPADKMEKRRQRIKKQQEWEEIWVKKQQQQLEQQEYWSSIRKKILERDNWTCQKCGFKMGRLDIHHIVKRKEKRVDTDDNLITLCRRCHQKADGKEYGIYEQ